MKKISLIILVLFCSVWIHAQQDSTKKVKYAALPLLNYSSSIKLTLGVMTRAFYKINANDTISPTSSSAAIGLYSTNHSYFVGFFQRVYLNEDRWRLRAGFGQGTLNFQYWQEMEGMEGMFVGYGNTMTFAMAQAERKVYDQLYAGVKATWSLAETEYDSDSIPTDSRKMNNLGYLLNFDKRDHQMNPYEGYNIAFKNEFYREWMGSGNNFNNFELTYNHYYTMGDERHILATRVKAAIATGDVPFQGQSVVGQDDIRGYSSGKYRDNQVYSMQAEYRWRFYKKFGAVGFFGLASAVEHAGDIFSSQLLPGAGVGVRYMMIPSERINIGIDLAKGVGDWGVNFRIGESFGR